MVTVLASVSSGAVANLMVIGLIAGMAIYGSRVGAFLAAIAGLAILTGWLTAMMLAGPAASMLESFDCPVGWAMPLAVIGIMTAVMAGCRVLLGEQLREDDVRFAGPADKLGGAVIGCIAGSLLAGSLLVGWSMLELPQWARLDTRALRFDAGARALNTYVRCCTADAIARRRMLEGVLCRHGEAGLGPESAARVSEPFDDVDADGLRDESEPFLDEDGNGAFTPERPLATCSAGEGGSGDLGLMDRYLLASWRRIRRLHAPKITSPATGEPPADAAGVIYRATADDADGEAVTFAVKPEKDGMALVVEVDPSSGEVRRREEAVAAIADPGKLRFKIVASDPGGLRDEKIVTVTLVGSEP